MPTTPPGPPVTLPGRFGPAGASPLPDAWWRYFDDRDLDRIVERALAGNFSLRSARARLQQARAVARQRGAAELPDLSLTGSVSGNRRLDGQHQSTAHSYSAGAAASYEIDLWGHLRSATEAAKMDAEASRADLEAAAITVSADVAGVFYDRVRQNALINLLEQQLKTNREIASLVELRYRNGRAGVDEVLRQRQLVEQTKAAADAAHSRKTLLDHQLAVLLGAAPGTLDLPDTSTLASIPPLPATGLPAEWLQRRPDLRAAWLRVRSADASLASAIAARFPRIDLTGSATSEAAATSDLFREWIGSLAGQLTAPLFEGGLRKARVAQARAARLQALDDYASAVLAGVQDVEDALVAQRRDRTQLQSLDRQEKLAREAMNQLRIRYLNGGAAYLDVLDALIKLQSIQRDRLDAHWTLITDRITLARAVAGSWQRPQNNQNGGPS